jgi:hypothetical protein
MNKPTHLAFGDESYSSAERYRSVAIVTMEATKYDQLESEVKHLLSESSVSEFKWKKLKNAKYCFAAEKLVDWVMKNISSRQVRVDVLVWDSQDQRHEVFGRDDRANLADMYTFLFRNVLSRRWGKDTTWGLHPDENSSIDWGSIRDRIVKSSYKLVPMEYQTVDMAAPTRLLLEYIRQYRVMRIEEASSTDNVFLQIADLFGGLGVFSRKHFDKYGNWLEANSPQMRLFPNEVEYELTNSEEYRCRVLLRLDTLCKQANMTVSLKQNRGLRTYDPQRDLLNFWYYEPQTEHDKAPTKNEPA